MRWLITGGAGFIGSHLVDAILARSLGEVVVFDSFFRSSRESLARHQGSSLLSVWEGDIRDADAVLSACRDVDVVMHLGARSNVMGSESQFQAACETNVVGTLNVLDAALTAGVQRLVFTSSREVYGDPATFPVAETSPLAPKNLYGASKAAGETYCSIYRQRGLDVRVLRLANVYGPRDKDRVIPLWLNRARQGLPLQVFGGDQVLDLIWIEHCVEALLRAAELQGLTEPVNVGSGIGTPIRDLAEAVIRATSSRSTVDLLPARAQEVRGYVADVTRMRSILGIEPPHDPLTYIASMVPVETMPVTPVTA
jgi:UDP-glucose 4-epimerase